jgi:hypothetical protein
LLAFFAVLLAALFLAEAFFVVLAVDNMINSSTGTEQVRADPTSCRQSY